MIINSIPGCCGVMEVMEFGGLSKANIISFLISQRWPGMYIATTVGRQKRAVAALQECGFRVLSTAKNPNTKAMITLWGRVGRPVWVKRS